MELSGEVLAGYFFHGLSGPQFISHEALRRLERALPEEAVWFMSAVDPASLCGLPIEPLKDRLPQRREGAHLVFHGSRLVLVSERFGRSLTAHVPPDDGRLHTYFVALRHLLSRRFRPLRRLVVETINGVEAARSPYADALRTGFDLAMDYKRLVIHSRPEPAGRRSREGKNPSLGWVAGRADLPFRGPSLAGQRAEGRAGGRARPSGRPAFPAGRVRGRSAGPL
jgi:ATP-dependent Lhr-like helicase